MADRYEINHEGQIVVGDSALCSDLDKMLHDLFSQYGWECEQVDKAGACRTLELTNTAGITKTYYVYCGTIRNEARNAYEKKIQLGMVSDPRKKAKDQTIILGVYVYKANDSYKDAIFVGYPIDNSIRYDTNPSIRGTFVNKLLIQAKTEGFVYDEEHNSVAFRAEFAFYYLSNYYDIHYSKKTIKTMVDVEYEGESSETDSSVIEEIGENILYYGVPGAGKSHTIKRDYPCDDDHMERVVFHPDYAYSDFVGQILPRVEKTVSESGEEKEVLRYVFTPGPFTKAVRAAYEHPQEKYYLIIEEINRGNAPAIFGEIFQLLDRDKTGESEYGIDSYDMANEIYGDSKHKVKIPGNLWILATMNTSDQNVFTLDTAFQRRWVMKHIDNPVTSAIHSDTLIEGSNSITWGGFAFVVNQQIIEVNETTGSSADKRLGAYFAQLRDLKMDRFPEKVLKYLWDDAFKMSHEFIFSDNFKSLDEVIDEYQRATGDPLAAVMDDEVYKRMQANSTPKTSEMASSEGTNPIENE